MWSSIKNFLHRHRRKFLVTGIVIGGVYVISSYAQKKLREWQEKEAKKFLEMTRKKQHHESTTRTCNQTILSLSKIVSDTILKLLNTDEIVFKLQHSSENKLELWEDMKIMIFTRICAIVYALCILQVTLRVQLNIIGGYLFKDSVYGHTPFVDGEIQAQYLSLCHHFVSNGVEELIKQIEKVVKQVLEPVSLKTPLNLQKVENIFFSIQTIMRTDPSDVDPLKKMAEYLTGHTQQFDDNRLDAIVKETVDILDSEEAISLASMATSRCFSSVMDALAGEFENETPPSTKNNLELVSDGDHIVTQGASKLQNSSDFMTITKIDLVLIKLLPKMNRLITEDSKERQKIPDLLTQQLTLNDKLKILGANIYESFSSP